MMNTTRSRFDPLNAGRQRKAYVAFEELNRSLDNLARQYGQAAQPLSRNVSTNSFTNDLEGLREELRCQMAASLQREFDMLRKDIELACASSPAKHQGAALAAELDRLSQQVRLQTGRGDERAINMLRLTLGSMKKLLDSLAAKGNAIPVEHLRKTPDADSPVSQIFTRRVDGIAKALNSLPDTGPVRSLEEKVHMLATAIENFMGQQDRRDNQTLAHIEERLDEISRGLAAFTAFTPSHFDAAPLEHIETCIASLARQVEELIENRPSMEIMEQLSVLSQRIEQIAGKVERNLDGFDANRILNGIDERFSVQANILEQFQQKCERFCARELQQNNKLEHFRDSEKSGYALEHGKTATTAPDAATICTLADKMKSLEVLTHRFDERNNRTFEAIHDTLLKIVDRIDALEQLNRKWGPVSPPQSQHNSEMEHHLSAQTVATPEPARAPASHQESKAGSLLGATLHESLHDLQSGSPAAATSISVETHGSPGLVRSMFGSISRALSGNSGTAGTTPQEHSAPEPKTSTADREGLCGTAPATADLNAIMRRVRDEHNRQQPCPDRERQVSRAGTGRA